MNRVKFTLEWDKLKEPRFTTIRSYNRQKEEFYRALVGQEFTILKVPHELAHPSKGRKIGSATLRSVEVVKPGELPADLVRRDVTHEGRVNDKWLDRVLEMDKALLLAFENHTGILAAGRDQT